MSDPAKSSAEIEDVLSSIRRLVAEHQPGPDGSARPVLRVPEDDTPGKLMLTPALRVADGDDPYATIAPKVPLADDAGWSADDRLASWDEVGIAAAADDEVAVAAVTADAPPAPRPDAPVDSATETVTETFTETAEKPLDDAHTDDGLDDLNVAVIDEVSDDPDADLILAEELAELARLDGADPAEGFEPEIGDDNWPDDGAGRVAANIAAKRGAPEQHVNTPPTDTPEIADAPEATSAARETDASDNDAGDTSATDTDADDEGPATDFTPIFSRRPVAQAATHAAASSDDRVVGFDKKRDAAPKAGEMTHDDFEDLGEEPSPFTFPEGDDSVLDEETLREIIADVVRQELQGVLGQRITRNVRKMVRREIRLALAAEELD